MTKEIAECKAKDFLGYRMGNKQIWKDGSYRFCIVRVGAELYFYHNYMSMRYDQEFDEIKVTQEVRKWTDKNQDKQIVVDKLADLMVARYKKLFSVKAQESKVKVSKPVIVKPSQDKSAKSVQVVETKSLNEGSQVGSITQIQKGLSNWWGVFKGFLFNKKDKRQEVVQEYDVGVENTAHRVDTCGLRNELSVSSKLIDEIKKYAVSLGMEKDRIYYRENSYTMYGPAFDWLVIGTDVLPKGNIEVGDSANSRMSWKCCIAHEIIGHRQSHIKGKSQLTQKDKEDYSEGLLSEEEYKYKSGLEEAQASYRAMLLTEGLSERERLDLKEDAENRLKAINRVYAEVKQILFLK